MKTKSQIEEARYLGANPVSDAEMGRLYEFLKHTPIMYAILRRLVKYGWQDDPYPDDHTDMKSSSRSEEKR